MRTFGRPQGILGRLGGIIMARTNAGCGAWVTDLLDVGPNDNVLEVGFGPGVVIQRLSKRAQQGMSRGLIRRVRWSSKLALGTRPPSRTVVSTCGVARD